MVVKVRWLGGRGKPFVKSFTSGVLRIWPCAGRRTVGYSGSAHDSAFTMIPTQFVSIVRASIAWLFVFCFALPGFAEPLGTLVREFNYAVLDFARDPIRERIYATTTENSIIVINTKTVQIDAEIFIGSNPVGLDVNADGSRLYVACSGSSAAGIGVVDLATLEKLPSLPTPYLPADVAAGLGGRLYISPGDGASFADLKQLSAVDGAVQADLGSAHSTYYGAQLALTPDRKKLFMGNVGLSAGTLVRFDVATPTPVFEQQSSNLGSDGNRVVISHAGDALSYVVSSSSGGYNVRLIAVGDMASSIGVFECGAYPKNGVFSPDDEFFYTAPFTQNNVQVFSRNSFLKTASFSVPQDTLDMVTDATGRRLYLAGTDFFNPGKLRVYGTGRGATELEINHPSTVDVRRGEVIRVEVTSSQSGVTFSATGLPTGVSIHSGTGILSGTPTVAGNYTVQLRAVNTAGDEALGELALNVLTPFTVTVSGGGSVTWELLGTTWQRIGAEVVLTATPDHGFDFAGWTGSHVSNSRVLTVVVAANLTLSAHFTRQVDSTVDFTVEATEFGEIYPESLRGKTRRVVGEKVMIRAVAGEGARFTGWSGSVTSTANPLNVTVHGGETIIANFEPDAAAGLTVGATGSGAVTGVSGGRTQHEIGEVIKLHAVPLPGSRFVGWAGSFTSAQSPLTFAFQGPTTLVAQFESLQNYVGSFRALIAADSVLEVKVGKDGVVTGKLRHSGETYAFKGNAAGINGVTFFLEREGDASPLAVGLRLALHDGLASVMVQLDDGAFSFNSVASRRAVVEPNESSLHAGRYTLQIPPPDAASFGYGYGTVNVTRTGSVRITGVLGDGCAFSEGSYLTEGDNAMIHVPLFRKEGLISGNVHFDETAAGSDFVADLNWSRPARPGAKQYAAGFERSVTMLGSRFHASSSGVNLIPFSAGSAVIEGGGLLTRSTTQVELIERNTFASTVAALGKFTARLLPKTGKLSGSFQLGGRTQRGLSGVVFQKTGVVIGQHIGPAVVGSVRLEER